jgi:hypothetical protein
MIILALNFFAIQWKPLNVIKDNISIEFFAIQWKPLNVIKDNISIEFFCNTVEAA